MNVIHVINTHCRYNLDPFWAGLENTFLDTTELEDRVRVIDGTEKRVRDITALLLDKLTMGVHEVTYRE